MRGLRSFGGMLAILVALGAYLYFVDSKKTPGDDADKKEKVFTVEADKIEEISIKSESGEKTTLKKTGSDWQIVQPVAAKPDDAEISGLTSNLSRLEIQRVIDENAADLSAYGLEPARVEVTFKADGKQQTLHIGQKTPPGTDHYARLADQKKVFLISSYLDSTFNRTTFDLRDKAALKLDRDKIDAVEIATADGQMRFAKAETEWRMTAPVDGRADGSTVEGLIGRLGSLQMKSLAAAEPADLKQYGLDTPDATVKIGTGSSQATIVFGKKAESGDVYAKDLARPAVFTVEGSLLDELKKAPGDFRQKDLFDARAFNATRIEVTRGGQTVAFEKAKVKDKDGKEEEKWRQTAPTARDIDNAKVDALLSAATGARADTWVAGAAAKADKDAQAATKALAKPELSIVVKFDEGKKEDRVALARSGSDAYASRAGEGGAAKVQASTLDSIVKALEELK